MTNNIPAHDSVAKKMSVAPNIISAMVKNRLVDGAIDIKNLSDSSRRVTGFHQHCIATPIHPDKHDELPRLYHEQDEYQW